jgi:hypothetical protein
MARDVLDQTGSMSMRILGAFGAVLIGCREPSAPPGDTSGANRIVVDSLPAVINQRTIRLTGAIKDDAASPTWRVRVTADEGTTSQQVAEASVDRTLKTWELTWPDTLADGRRTFHVRYYSADTTLRGTRVVTVTIQIPAILYRLAVLPGLGGTDAEPLDINDRGVVVGWAMDMAGVQRPVRWQDGLAAPLDSLAGYAAGINFFGDIVLNHGASSINPTGEVLWHTGARTALTDTATGEVLTRAVDINYRGTVIAHAKDPAGGPSCPTQGARWRNGVVERSQVMRNPASLNDSNQVVGSTPASCFLHVEPNAVGWNVAFKVLPPGPPGGLLGRPLSEAVRVNNSGHVAGTRGTLGWPSSSFLATSASAAVDLALALGSGTTVHALDNTDHVTAFDSRSHTVYRWQSGTTSRVVIAESGWRLDRITNANAAGWIIGHATRLATGQKAAVVLTPQ